MDVNVVPNFQTSPEAYAPAVQAYNLMLDQLRGMGITRDENADVYTALIGGLVNQQLASDPGGQRWRRLIPRVMSMFAADLGLPPASHPLLRPHPLRLARGAQPL
jgi:hypothetical protein